MTTNQSPDRSSGRSAELQRLLDEAAGIAIPSSDGPLVPTADEHDEQAEPEQTDGDDGTSATAAAAVAPATIPPTPTGHMTASASNHRPPTPAQVARRARMMAKAAEAERAMAHGLSPARVVRMVSLSLPAATTAPVPHAATANGAPEPTWDDALVEQTATTSVPPESAAVGGADETPEAAVDAAQDEGDALLLRGGPDYPMQVARGAILAGASPRFEPQPDVPEPKRRNQRKALLLAGGVAAAVVAIVAITVGGRLGSDSGSADVGTPSQVALVQTTGPDGKVTQVTVTAPTSTVGGRLVALVTGADGSVQQLPVVNLVDTTQSSPTPSTTSGLPTTRTTTPTTQLDVAGTSRSTAGSNSSNSSGTSPRSTTTPSTRTTRPSTTGTVDQPGVDDTATVVVGTSKLTGWVLLTTPSAFAGLVPPGNADSVGPLTSPASTAARPAPRTTTAGSAAGGGSGGGTTGRPGGSGAPTTSNAPAPRTTRSNPTSSAPGTTEPAAGAPGTTEPAATEPGTTDPGTTEPVTTESESSEPGSTAETTPDEPTTDPASTCVSVSVPDLPVIGGVLPTAVTVICP